MKRIKAPEAEPLPLDRARRRARGKEAQRKGAGLEAQILASLHQVGIYAVHIPTPVQLLRPLDSSGGRLMIARLETPRAPDFLGVLPCGRALAIEAKRAPSGGRSWPMPERLRGHQGEALREVARRGGLALVLVEREDGGRFAVPWPEGDPRGEDGEGRVSFVWAELEARWMMGMCEGWGETVLRMKEGEQ